jgi:arabinogalactan endo-1,4-beta-galactosidase
LKPVIWILISVISIARAAGADEFVAGSDMSHLVFFEDRGIAYRDGGVPQDALVILQRRGLNCARLRLFTSSAQQAQANPYNFTNNLDYTLPLAVRVRNAGLQFMLDFHYSDSWADPGKQTKPAAWTNLSFAQLEQQMYEYNSNTIAAFKTAGAMPEYVQVGNEIIQGLLWPDGKVGGSSDTPAQWQKLGGLLKAAIRGIRDAAGAQSPKLVIHIDRGGDWAGTQWFFDNLRQQQVEFDIIGESYYPWWHGSLDALRRCLTNATVRYGKPLMIAETAFPWATNGAPIVGIDPGVDGQVAFIIELAKAMKNVPGGKGIGIFWWGTEYQRVPGVSLAGFDTRSFFGGDGTVLPAADALGQLTAPITLTAGLTDTALTLQWPFSGAGMSLMTTTSLTASAVWLAVTNAIQTTGATFTTTLMARTNCSRFYRLESR